MHDATAVRRIEAAADALEHGGDLALRGLGTQPRRERAPGDELHHEVHAAREHADVVDRDHVGVRELAPGAPRTSN